MKHLILLGALAPRALQKLLKMLPLVLLIFMSSLSATYIFFNADELDEEKKVELFYLLMQAEPPSVFCRADKVDLKETCRGLSPNLDLQWITPTSWQIAALHAFFQNSGIQQTILACAKSGLDPLVYDGELHDQLSNAQNLETIAAFFDAKSQSLPGAKGLFFALNQAIAQLYERAERRENDMVTLALAELPSFSLWREKEFPFWKSPWIYNPGSAEIFYKALMDENLIRTILQIEQNAHQRGEWVLYRGYSGAGYPTTLQTDDAGSHALSFGSTLLGGAFFSLEATALTYAHPIDQGQWSFLVLRVALEELQKLFRIGPLHPFIQLLVDGEMFHAHTKVAAEAPDAYLVQPVQGYFMACNRHCVDPIGYILALQMKPEELEDQFQTLCAKSGIVFLQTIE